MILSSVFFSFPYPQVFKLNQITVVCAETSIYTREAASTLITDCVFQDNKAFDDAEKPADRVVASGGAIAQVYTKDSAIIRDGCKFLSSAPFPGVHQIVLVVDGQTLRVRIRWAIVRMGSDTPAELYAMDESIALASDSNEAVVAAHDAVLADLAGRIIAAIER